MKNKYVKMIAFQILYLAIIVLSFIGIYNFQAFISSLSQAFCDFILKNYMLITTCAMMIPVLVFMLIFRLRKKSLLKVCSFKMIDIRNIIIIFVTGLCMGIFTVSFVSIDVIDKAFPSFNVFMVSYVRSMENFWVLLIVMFFTILFEEIMYRAVIFNEFRAVLPLSLSILFHALLYGIPNGIFNPGWIVGVFAFFSSVCYALPYVWTGSLSSAVWIQVVCQFFMLISWYMGINRFFNRINSMLLLLITVVSAAVMVLCFIRMWKYNSRKPAGNTQGEIATT